MITNYCPDDPKSKQNKRIYMYYDKDIASAMFGFRLDHDKELNKQIK